MTAEPPVAIEIGEHPLLRAAAFTTRFPAPLGGLPTPDEVRVLLDAGAPAPMRRDEAVRAAGEGALAGINLAVPPDACNASRCTAGSPISSWWPGLPGAPAPSPRWPARTTRTWSSASRHRRRPRP